MSEDLRRLVRILIAILVPVFAAAIAEWSHSAFIVLSVPLLLCCSEAMLAVLALAILGVIGAMQFTAIGRVGDVVFISAAIGAAVSALRYTVYDSATLGWIARKRGRSRVVARLLFLLGIGLLVAIAFDDAPWIASLVLGIGYVALGHRFRTLTAAPVTSRSNRTALINAAVALIAVVLSLAILEIGCRSFVNFSLLPGGSLGAAEPNGGTLWAPRRSWQGRASIVRGMNDVVAFSATHSAQGWRGPEIGPKLPNELRIALLGDSMTYGWGVDDDETIDSYLRELVGDQPRTVTFVNMGVFGFAPWQEIELFRQRGLPLDPDVLILQLYPTNDIGESLLKHGEILGNFDLGARANYRYWMGQNEIPERMERALRSKSSAYNAYRTSRPRWIGLNDILEKLRFVSSPMQLRIASPRMGRDVAVEIKLREYYPALARAYAAFEMDTLAIAELCKQEGIEFYVYLMPSSVLGETAWQALFEKSRQRTGESLEFDMLKDVRLVEDLIRSNEFRTIPVYATFTKLPDTQPLFIQRDGHLTSEGNKVVAEIIADQLLRDGFLESIARSSEPDPKFAEPN